MTLTTAHSQNRQIVVDKVNDNVRIIEAQGTCIGGFTATKLLFIAMQTYVSPQDTVHKIITNVNTSHSLGAFDDAIMLIRTMNDEVIELHSDNSNNNVKTIQYGLPTITTTRTKNLTTTTYNSNATDVCRNINYWSISVENINKLKSGVKKIKIQFEKGIYEKEFKKDKIGTILYDGYLSELKQMAKDKNQDFKDNF